MKRDEAITGEVLEVQRRLAAWRTSRLHREAVPEVLWSSAISLAKTQGVSRIARVLGLNSYELRKRLAIAHPAGPTRSSNPTFVELALPSRSVLPTWTVELENRRGAKMRVHLPGGSTEVIALVQTFWNQGR